MKSPAVVLTLRIACPSPLDCLTTVIQKVLQGHALSHQFATFFQHDVVAVAKSLIGILPFLLDTRVFMSVMAMIVVLALLLISISVSHKERVSSTGFGSRVTIEQSSR
ncbi:hypothetical protein NKJ19_22400 [Mesorhizobium sp. M0203]